MKNSILALALFFCAAPMLAQPSGLNVKKGQTFGYEVKTEMNVTQTMGAQKISAGSTVNSSAVLSSTNVEKGKIDWQYEIGTVRVSTDNPTMPGTTIDTTLDGGTIMFSTSPKGEVMDLKSQGNDQIGVVVGGMFGNQQNAQARGWFHPGMAESMKVGETQEIHRIDTIDRALPADQIGGGPGEDIAISMITTSTMKMTYQGSVDTLGVKTSRYHVELAEVTIEGTMMAGGMGMEMLIDGDGTGAGTAYYSDKDGLLLVNQFDQEINVRLVATGQMSMIIPIQQKSLTTTVRVKK